MKINDRLGNVVLGFRHRILVNGRVRGPFSKGMSLRVDDFVREYEAEIWGSQKERAGTSLILTQACGHGTVASRCFVYELCLRNSRVCEES